MFNIVLYFLSNVLVVMLLSAFLPGFSAQGIWQISFFIIVLTVINWTILPIIKLLTLPINFFTLGIFNFFLNLIVIIIVANSIKDISIEGRILEKLIIAFVISACLSLINSLVNLLIKAKNATI